MSFKNDHRDTRMDLRYEFHKSANATHLRDLFRDRLRWWSGAKRVKTGQREIASDWIEAYKKYVRTTPLAPIVHETKTAPASTANEVSQGKHALWQIMETRFTVLRKNQAGRVHVGVGSADNLRQVEPANRLCRETKNLRKLSLAEQSRL